MLSQTPARRFFCSSLRAFTVKNFNLGSVYTNLLEKPCFTVIQKHLPTEIDDLDPFEFSQKIDEVISKAILPPDHVSMIRNTIIETLSKYEYGISTLQTKKLETLGLSPSYKSILEIINNNPGRVSSSWELLLKYSDSLRLLPDELLTATLDNIVAVSFTDPTNGPYPLASFIQCMLIVKNIGERKCINSRTLNKLLVAALDNEITCFLPLILSSGILSLQISPERLDSLTPLQVYFLTKSLSFDAIRQNRDLLYRSIDVLGELAVITESEKEAETAKSSELEIKTLSQNMPVSWKACEMAMGPQTSAQLFLDIFESIQLEGLDKKDFKIAIKLIRTFGIYRDNIKMSLELYHRYLTNFPDHSHELMFEIFLVLAFQSYKTSNETLFKYSEAFLPANTTEAMSLRIFQVLILLKTKYDIEEALNFYNEINHQFSKDNNPQTNISPCGLLAESLILGYLTKGEIDFARVIFEGCAREQVLQGPTAIKRVKKLMSLYGEALESEALPEKMELEVLRKLRNL